MDSSVTNEMKQKLEEEREDLRKRLGNLGKEDKRTKDDYHSNFPQYGDKDEDNATEVAEYQDSLSVEGNLERRLKEVEESLKKIEVGKYGICEKCSQEIDQERLKVNPAANMCVKCTDL